jgi:uncharacterized protein with ParB-like and HNH nuclease domain
MNNQPKPDSKTYDDLISEIKKGIIKVPKFQRDFVWDIWKTASLLDSILKGYPMMRTERGYASHSTKARV